MDSSSEPHDSLVGLLVGVHVAMISLATITVAGRLAVRLSLTRGGLGGDDIVITIAWLLGLAFVTVNLYQTNFGLGQHIYDLPPTTNFETSEELFYFGEMLYYITVGTTKIAVLILYLRIIPNRTYRYIIYGLMSFVVLTVFASVVANIFQCTPISYDWNKAQSGHCINQVALYFSNAGLDIFQDICIYLLPIRALARLQLPSKQRIALIAIFVVGGFVCITGILRLNSLKTAAVTSDPTYYNVGAANWSVVEICIGIFCASLVHYKPLVMRFAPYLIGTGKAQGNSGGTSTSLHRGRRPGFGTDTDRPNPQEYVEMEPPSESLRHLRP